MEMEEGINNELDETLEVQEERKEEKQELIQNFINEIHEKIEQERSKIVLVVDRFEGNIAVCEDRDTEEITNIDKSELPEDIREGDVLKFNNNKYEIDEEMRKEIEERIKSKIRNLFEEE